MSSLRSTVCLLATVLTSSAMAIEPTISFHTPSSAWWEEPPPRDEFACEASQSIVSCGDIRAGETAGQAAIVVAGLPSVELVRLEFPPSHYNFIGWSSCHKSQLTHSYAEGIHVVTASFDPPVEASGKDHVAVLGVVELESLSGPMLLSLVGRESSSTGGTSVWSEGVEHGVAQHSLGRTDTSWEGYADWEPYVACVRTTPTHASSWGRVKASYR